jgi:hypothetical protein
MTRKEEVELNRLLAKIGAMNDVVLSLLADRGHWEDGTGKGRLVFQADKAEISDVRVTMSPYSSDGYFIHLGGTKIKFPITDKDMQDVLNTGVNKVKEEKIKAKQKADEERQKKSKIGNMDIFNRVAAFLKKNGYTINAPKSENEIFTMKVGSVTLRWNNLKDFVFAGYDVHACWDREGYISIFRVISYWANKYYKLSYPSLRKLVDKVGVLGKVSEHAKVPVAIMDELNRLEI